MACTVHLAGRKEAVEVNDPSTYWLTFTNIALGVVTLLAVAVVFVGVAQEIAGRCRKQAAMQKLDTEVADLVHSYPGEHTFQVPELGVTMADGGEPVKPEPPARGIRR